MGKRLTAEEARAMVRTSEGLLDETFLAIEEAAGQGKTFIALFTGLGDPKVPREIVTKCVQELESLHYKVSVYNNGLKIEW